MMDFRFTPPALSLPVVIGTLRAAVASWGGRGLMSQALTWLLYLRLKLVGDRLGRMLVRFAAGLPMRRLGPVDRKDSSQDLAREERIPRRRDRVWPVRFGWLLGVGKHEAAGYGAHLRLILERPEMVALLEAAPQAGLLLRPLCRALGIEASLLRLPVKVRCVPEACAVAVKAKRVRAKVEWRYPFPRGVLAWARRERAGRRILLAD